MKIKNDNIKAIDAIKDILFESDIFDLSFEDIKINGNIRNLAILLIIVNCICKYYNINYKSLSGNSREQPLPFGRQIYCYLCRTIYFRNRSLNLIGEFINKDHATVLHGCKKINEYMETKNEIWYDLLNIIDDIDLTLKEYNL